MTNKEACRYGCFAGEANSHFNERELAALTLSIALTNLWNRLNITTRQVAGEWVKSAAAKEWMETVEK